MYLGGRSYLHRRTDTKDFILQNVDKVQGQWTVVMQFQKPHTVLKLGAAKKNMH